MFCSVSFKFVCFVLFSLRRRWVDADDTFSVLVATSVRGRSNVTVLGGPVLLSECLNNSFGPRLVADLSLVGPPETQYRLWCMAVPLYDSPSASYTRWFRYKRTYSFSLYVILFPSLPSVGSWVPHYLLLLHSSLLIVLFVYLITSIQTSELLLAPSKFNCCLTSSFCWLIMTRSTSSYSYYTMSALLFF